MVELTRIITGEIDPSTPGKQIERSEWKHLLSARGSYCTRQFQHDCKELLFFIEDGRENNFFGYPDEITYWREGLCLEPEAVPFAEKYLRTRQARLEAGIDGRDWREVSFDKAVKYGKRGGDRRSLEYKITHQMSNAHLKGTGSIERTLARLDRYGKIELAAKVRAGELSANAAAIKAGFRKKPIKRCPKCGHEW